MLCQKCYGSFRVMGMGMMYEDCPCLYDEEMPMESKEVKPLQINKRTKAYREAIQKIMSENDMSRDEASRLFEEEFYKIA